MTDPFTPTTEWWVQELADSKQEAATAETERNLNFVVLVLGAVVVFTLAISWSAWVLLVGVPMIAFRVYVQSLLNYRLDLYRTNVELTEEMVRLLAEMDSLVADAERLMDDHPSS